MFFQQRLWPLSTSCGNPLLHDHQQDQQQYNDYPAFMVHAKVGPSFIDIPNLHLILSWMSQHRSTTPISDESAVLVVPMDICRPKIRVQTQMWQRLVGMRLLVQVDGWDVGSSYPHGHITKVLGPMGDMESEITCLLLENQVWLDPFSVAACACLPKEGTA
jgi:hypothetical protein